MSDCCEAHIGQQTMMCVYELLVEEKKFNCTGESLKE